MTRAASIMIAVWVTLVAPEALAAPVRYAGSNAELSVSAVSEGTAQVVLAPLDENGKPRSAPPSTVLVEQQPQVKLRRQELGGPEEVAVGKLRVRVKPQPLTLSVEGPSGKVVQELA